MALVMSSAPTSNAEQIDPEELSEIVRVLASDEFEGRAPGGPGEAKTIAYLVKKFEALGLIPGGEQGSWTQSVPLVHTQVQKSPNIRFNVGKHQQMLQQAIDIAVETSRPREEIGIKSAPLVFVGFGASAPWRQWDDYGDIDLTGKVAGFRSL
ncbi:MAG: hypothetical protein ACJA09_001186 [Alcanivorax sp.]|jgi:hypothetical protein